MFQLCDENAMTSVLKPTRPHRSRNRFRSGCIAVPDYVDTPQLGVAIQHRTQHRSPPLCRHTHRFQVSPYLPCLSRLTTFVSLLGEDRR